MKVITLFSGRMTTFPSGVLSLTGCRLSTTGTTFLLPFLWPIKKLNSAMLMHHLATFAWCCAMVVNHLRFAWSVITLTFRPSNIGAKLSESPFYRKELLVYSYPTWFSWWKCSGCKSYRAKHVVLLLSQNSSTPKLARIHMWLRLGVPIRIEEHHTWASDGLHQVSAKSKKTLTAELFVSVSMD